MGDEFNFWQPPAVVVGACGHSLAVMRALRAARLPVIALEANTRLPGYRTRLAQVVSVPDINGNGLVESLRTLRVRINCPGRPVLFLTNDSMVRTIGEHWDVLAGLYDLSWADARSTLLPLLEKPALEERCRTVGLSYPKTFVLNSVADVDAAASAIGFPMIVKPSRPLSRFKTAQPDSAASLSELVERLGSDLPFLVQQFIPGDDTSIYFSALYLDHGAVLARFDGHKVRSRPLGHTTIAESAPDDSVFAHACRFFQGLQLSGPVSLELKRDDQGRLWVIEPTVGRTDFWLGLCTANGVNLPLLEYRHQCGDPLPEPRQQQTTVWFNEDRDPLGRLWMARRYRGGLRGRKSSFTYLHWQDPWPAIRFLRLSGLGLLRSMSRRFGWGTSVSSVGTALPCEVLASFRPLHQRSSWQALNQAGVTTFETPAWFENLDATCETPGSTTLVLAIDFANACSVLPIRRRSLRRFESLSNFYASLYGPAMTCAAAAWDHAHAFADWFARHRASTLRLHPVNADSPFWQAFVTALRARGYWVDRYFAFGNWYHPCDNVDGKAYIASRPSHLRNSIARKRRKLQKEAGFDVSILDARASPTEVERAVDKFKQVYARSWKKPEPHPAFIGSFCRVAHAHGWLRIGLCHLDGQPVAAQIWLVKSGVASIFKLAYDERHASKGVGTVLSASLSEHVLDVDRVHEIDFLAGDDAYKSDWMACRRERHGIIAFRQRSILGLWSAMWHFGARLVRRPTTRSHWEGRSPTRAGSAAARY